MLKFSPAPIHEVSPGLTAGGGLKLVHSLVRRGQAVVSPGLTAGGGLKHDPDDTGSEQARFPPASPPGAD